MTAGAGRLVLEIANPILNASGQPASGSVLTFYNAGTSDIADLFAEEALSTPIANPLTADSAGRFFDQAETWWADDARAYDATIDVAGGSTLTFLNLYTLGAQSNVSGLAPLDSPTFVGTPTAPTPASNDDSSKLATTAFVSAQNFAPLNSPGLTGVPTTPTAATGTSTTQIASTAFVEDALSLTNLASFFTQSLGTNGYITLPGGLLVQWGTKSPGDDSYTLYNLPTPYLVAHYACVAVVKLNSARTGGNGGGAIAYPASLTQIGLGIAWNGDSTGVTDVMFVSIGR